MKPDRYYFRSISLKKDLSENVAQTVQCCFKIRTRGKIKLIVELIFSVFSRVSDVYETLATYPDSFMDNVIHTCGCMRVGGGLQHSHGQGGVGNSNINQQEQNRPLKRRPQSSRSSLRGSSLHQNNAYYSSPAGITNRSNTCHYIIFGFSFRLSSD